MILFKGKKYISIDKYPDWSSGKDRFVKTLINLGFTKINLRIKADGYSDYTLKNANKTFHVVSPYLRGNIYIEDTYDFEEHNRNIDSNSTLYGYNMDGKLCGAIEDYAFLYKYDCLVDSAYSNVYYSEKKNCYIGLSHRAICFFKIGDKIFEENWIPTDLSEIPKSVLKKAKKVKDDNRSIYEIAVEYMPFTKRGSDIIENLSDCRLAARNFANYVS